MGSGFHKSLLIFLCVVVCWEKTASAVVFFFALCMYFHLFVLTGRVGCNR